ncbi:peptide chain release factor N(5)-glutamine methyltransferase [Candidatus Berkelbacteria bacterium CG08_land_8_20_14_0_20_39_8]|uniref:Peptide chain release factor N(5)-glutamine methyltransferase n=1 Tax=Candidatus Berkelbacteria bacterium CG08_land_8_20_14_0_20_39_8 TaxID=1974511 RepID=A0A2M6YBZ8_9BACT|nr:MAG: peptide chain release factor N(5)-glutamine methyltransferase [Candidatus Berkelbacteria bacterium CG08_land_8_20_14_0_20_39_8]
MKIVSKLKKAGIKSAETDAKVLLEFVTGKSREFLLANPKFGLSDNEIKKLGNLVARRKKHEPIAYITGHKEFFGLDFCVDRNVLIPRPETETLVELAIDFIKSKQKKYHTEFASNSKSTEMAKQPRHNKLKILDIGTGSGNIIISIAKKYRFEPIGTNRYFFASDISKSALEVARINAKKHGVGKSIKFIQSDLLNNISGKFDLIVANLPYVPIGGSDNNEIKFEPHKAIFADNNGEKLIEKLLANIKKHLNNSGEILLEVDSRNTKNLTTYATKFFSSTEIIKDYSSKDRFIKIGDKL